MEYRILKNKLNTPKYKVIMVLSYIVFITLFDCYFYGIVYQQKMAENNRYKNGFYGWMFQEQKSPETGIITVPNYRIIQKTIEITGLLVILYFCGILPALGIVLAHYFMSFDLLFYLFLNQTDLFAEFERLNNTYWLQNRYQAGYFLLNPFNTIAFYASGLTGIALAISSCFIKVKGGQHLRS